MPPRRRRTRRIVRLAIVAALGAWLLQRRRAKEPPGEGTWREVGSSDGWVSSQRR